MSTGADRCRKYPGRVAAVLERIRRVGWRTKATALGLAIFVVWTVLLNVGPLANPTGRIVLLALVVVTLLAGTVVLTRRRR